MAAVSTGRQVHIPTPLSHLKCPSSPISFQDVAAAAVLSETVYRAVDFGEGRAEEALLALQSRMPVPIKLEHVGWSPAGQRQRYLIASTDDALYVAFLGTKLPRDHMANLDARLTRLWPDSPAAAHSGYSGRASLIPIQQLFALAAVQGKRLVLAGHSMGGAVATLCALSLLRSLPLSAHGLVACVGFATPPLGNAQLAGLVTGEGWDSRIHNYLLPEDWVPELINSLRRLNRPREGERKGLVEDSKYAARTATAIHERVCCGTGPRHRPFRAALSRRPAARRVGLAA
ncbi:CGL69A [Auxenochlorella protothecoides x Auxenochlorella symbiontica]